MGLLQKGQWVDQWYDTASSQGEFKRQASRFRHWITADVIAQTNQKTSGDGFTAEADRFHLYVSLACPWAHRTLIFRVLKNLQPFIGVTVVEPVMLDNGWELTDSLNGTKYLYELYLLADKSYEGRVTVPVLWDKKTQTIVNNESADIIRMFNTAFNHLTGNSDDYYPDALRKEIDQINERIYNGINNGVYRAGFATTQKAYEVAFNDVFATLDWVEERLQSRRYLCGEVLTEADWRLFTTLIRFDAVYYGHFKTNRQRISDYTSLSRYLQELYHIDGVAGTVDFEHIKTHYYVSHKSINPNGIVPVGPDVDNMLGIR